MKKRRSFWLEAAALLKRSLGDRKRIWQGTGSLSERA